MDNNKINMLTNIKKVDNKDKKNNEVTSNISSVNQVANNIRKPIQNTLNENFSVEMPVDKFKAQIIETINNNPVTVITAETGAGKSTKVPQYLLDEGYKVVVTQPRRLAARSLATYISKQRGEELGNKIGYRTAQDRKDSSATDLLFCTDGLQLVRELTGSGMIGEKTVLVLDEVHEWNTNMETLVAWSKQQINKGIDFKVVLMSATLDAEKLSGFFNNEKSEQAPSIKIPGRLFPVEEKVEAENMITSETMRLAKDGRNVLVFQPGKKEIEQTIKELQEANINAIILPLHGQLNPAEQQRIFKHYDKPKIVVSTNVAQTSITIDDIDAVVDSGVERRIELRDGVEGLYLKNISQADCKQRKGRAGRCKSGEYVLCSAGYIEDREKYPKPEIQRIRLDQTVLRLASSGLDATELEFFHQPDISVLKEAKRALIALGAMDKEGNVTKIGHKISKLPISVHIGRMVIEAEKRGCLNDALTIAACMEVGGLKNWKNDNWKYLTKENESDVLAELDFYNAASGMNGNSLFDAGINTKSFYRAKEIRRRLISGIKHSGINFNKDNKENKENILRAVVAGMVDNLYKNDGYGDYTKNGIERQKDKNSIVQGNPNWIVGKPKDIQFKNRRGDFQTINLLDMCSKVDPEWLVDVAPQLVEVDRRRPSWDSISKMIIEEEFTKFNGIEIKSINVPGEINEDTKKYFYTNVLGDNLMDNDISTDIYLHNQKVKEQTKELEIRSGGNVIGINNDEKFNLYKKLLDKYNILSFKAFEDLIFNEGFDYENLKLNLDDFISPEKRNEIEKNNPENIEIDGIIIPLKYESGYYNDEYQVLAELDEDFVRNTNIESIILPNNRIAELHCNGYLAKSFSDLIDKLEENRINNAWTKIKNEIEKTSWISDTNEVLKYLPEIYKKIEITDNGKGDIIYGYVSLYSDSDPDFKIYLRNSKENAEEETKIALKRLVIKANKDNFIIPREYPWYDKNDYSTDMYNILKTAFNNLKESISDNLSIKDINLEIDKLSKKIYELKLDIGGKYIKTNNLLSTLDEKYNLKVEEMKNELNFEVDKSFKEEIKNYFSEAYEYLKKSNFTEAINMAKTIKEKISNIAESASDKEKQIENGEILVNFTWHYRGSGVTGRSNAWVIRPDGTLREKDTDNIRRHKSDGDLVWNIVNPEELAVSWSCGTIRDINGTSDFNINKLPVNGLTPEQLDAIKNIETDYINTNEGMFGLDPEAGERQNKFMENARKAYPELDISDENYMNIIGSEGSQIYDYYDESFIDWNADFETTCNNRAAQVINERNADGGILEVVAYDKYGRSNFNLRFVKTSNRDNFVSTSEKKLNDNKSDNEPANKSSISNAFADAFNKTENKKTKAELMADKNKMKEEELLIKEQQKAENFKNTKEANEAKKVKENKLKLEAEEKERNMFNNLNDMNEDEIYQEYEGNEEVINKILTDNPDIDSLFYQYYNATEDLLNIDNYIKQAIDSRDLSRNDNKKNKAIDEIKKLKTKKIELEKFVKNNSNHIEGMTDIKYTLDKLRERQVKIEKNI